MGHFQDYATWEIHASSTLCASASFMWLLCGSIWAHPARYYRFCLVKNSPSPSRDSWESTSG